MLKTMLIAVAAGSVTVPASAGTRYQGRPSYELKRAPMGPRPDQYVFERVDRQDGAERPRRPTGQTDVPAKRRLVQRWTGTHYIGPVWELGRHTD